MLRISILVLVAACGSAHPAIDAKTDPLVCKAELEASIDRQCAVAGDCVLVSSADCCGTVVLAVKRGTESGFPAQESTFETCVACPPLGCNHADMAEVGGTPGAGQSIVATCDTGRCKAIVSP